MLLSRYNQTILFQISTIILVRYNRTISFRSYHLISNLDNLQLIGPTDSNKLPDLLDFFITEGTSINYINTSPKVTIYHHSPAIVTISSTQLLQSFADIYI